VPSGFSSCLFCAEQAVADFVRNTLLYLPLGFGLHRRFGSWGVAIGFGLLLSAGVEAAQLSIPGRFSTLSDLIANGFGSAAGAFLAVSLFPQPGAGLRRKAAFVALALVTTVAFVAPALFYRYQVPDGALFGNWTPRIRGAVPYEGRLFSAELEGTSLPARRVDDSQQVRDLLGAGRPLVLEFEYVPTPSSAPVFRIPTAQRLEALRVSVDGDDLLVTEYLVADALRMDRPSIRFPDFFSDLTPGDTTRLTLSRGPDEVLRASLDGEDAREGGFTVARGWGLVYSPGRFGGVGETIVDLLWIAVTLLAVSWAAPSRSVAVGAGGALLILIGILPMGTPLLATPIAHYLAGAAGIASALILRTQAATGWRDRATVRGRPESPDRAWKGAPEPLV